MATRPIRATFTLLSIALALLGARAALAQEPTSAPQRMQPFATIPQPASPASPLTALLGEPTGDPAALPGYFASAPLRLSLQNQIFPVGMAYDQCGTREDAAGNATGGIPTQRYTLLRLTPSLVLHGFTSGGCPIDGAIGGGVTYATRVAPSIWLVAGGGIYATPAPAQYSARRTRNDFRIDLIKKVDDTHSLSVGVGKRGVTIGGAF
jgi:hypothetical protein